MYPYPICVSTHRIWLTQHTQHWLLLHLVGKVTLRISVPALTLLLAIMYDMAMTHDTWMTTTWCIWPVPWCHDNDDTSTHSTRQRQHDNNVTWMTNAMVSWRWQRHGHAQHNDNGWWAQHDVDDVMQMANAMVSQQWWWDVCGQCHGIMTTTRCVWCHGHHLTVTATTTTTTLSPPHSDDNVNNMATTTQWWWRRQQQHGNQHAAMTMTRHVWPMPRWQQWHGHHLMTTTWPLPPRSDDDRTYMASAQWHWHDDNGTQHDNDTHNVPTLSRLTWPPKGENRPSVTGQRTVAQGWIVTM